MIAVDQRLLLVVPCFKESTRLPSFLESLGREFSGVRNVRILVVDDGSGPAEQEKISALVGDATARWPFVVAPLLLPSNLGKGGAIYAGWAKQEGDDWLAFVDADGACEAREVRRLWECASQLPSDVGALFGSRVKMLGRKVERLLYRHILGRIYATLASNVLNVEAYDSQCGLKFVRSEAYRAIREELTLQRYAFDLDLLTSLLRHRVAVMETPIDWHEVPGGKVRLFTDSLRMVRDVLSIRKRRKG
jgi:glycosyltransferase involved in cell wall biosynthesis